MLVNLYRAKTPIAVFSLPLLIGILSIPILVFPSEASFHFWNWQNYLDVFVKKEPWLNYALTVFILSVTAHQINNVYNRQTFYSKDTFLPGLIYVMGLFAFRHLGFAPELLAHLFLVLALRQFMRLRRQEGAKSIMFWGGIFIGLSIVFSFFTLALILLAFLALITFRPFVWREWLMIILGVALPLFYYVSILYFVKGNLDFKVADPVTPSEVRLDLFMASSFGFFGLLILGSIYRYFVIMSGQVNRFKKQSQLLFHFLWISGGIWALGYYGFDHVYLNFLIPVAFIISTPLLHGKNSTVNNGVVIIWLIISAANVFIVR